MRRLSEAKARFALPRAGEAVLPKARHAGLAQGRLENSLREAIKMAFTFP